MSETWAVARLVFTKLLRDRIFIPALIGGSALILFALLASLWGIEEFYKILFDFGSAGLGVIGSLVAIFWGTKSVHDAKKDGSIEVHLSAPISRNAWIAGNFLGLAIGLLNLAVILALVFQALMFFLGSGVFTADQLWLFPLLYLGWLVLGALAILLSSLTSSAVALFTCVMMWGVGLVASPIYFALGNETPDSTKKIVGAIAQAWNLRLFNIGEFLAQNQPVPRSELVDRGVYGLAVCVVLTLIAMLAFRRRDVGE